MDPDAPPPRHGIWRALPSIMITEILARSGFDLQILDCEHGAYDYQTLLADLVACERNGSAPYIRVSGTSKVEVQRCLDLGAHGIVFPQLADYDDFERAASWMDHAPTGTRGLNPFTRYGNYGFPERPGGVVEHPRFMPIIETLQAVEELDRILAIERINLVYLGTYDLSAQLGCPGQMDDPRMVEVVDRILSACREHQVPASTMALNPEAVRRLRERGIACVVHGVDTHRIRQGLEGIASQ